MRAALIAAGLLWSPPALVSTSAAAEPTGSGQAPQGQSAVLSVVTCRAPPTRALRGARWRRELDASLEAFAAAMRSLGREVELRWAPAAECPRRIEAGCYSTSGKVFCAEVALERLLFSLALLLSRAQGYADLLPLPARPASRRTEAVLDLLGRTPYIGDRSTIVVDSLMFPQWWDSYDFRFSSFPAMSRASPWIETAKRLHEQPADQIYLRARDLLVGFIVGHESFHALRGCAITAPSFSERSGYLDRLVALQQHEYSCPDPPSNAEVNADACGIRWLEAADRQPVAGLDPTGAKVARAAAMLILQTVFDTGLWAPPRWDPDWTPTGYLYPHLRSAAVHRTLFHLNGGDPRVGLCHDALAFLWDSVRIASRCLSGEGLESTAPRVDGGWRALLPSVEVPSRSPGRRESCLSGTAQPPAPRAPGRGDPSVAIRVLDLRSEAEHAIVETSAVGVQRKLDRPHVYAALSACLPADAHTLRLRLRYSHQGILDEVRGIVSAATRSCVHEALAGIKLSSSLDTAFKDPAKPYVPPGYVVVLELRRRD